jgi:fructoselysine-6-P-deglycase FrlB-like protein
MSFASEEIARQPQAWRKAAQVVAASPDLPVPGERVAVIGCGTSLYMATTYAALREARGLGETDAFAASEFPDGRAYDRYIAISRSGTTTEVLDCLAGRRGKGGVVVALTTNASLPIADVADSVIALDFADERSVVQTLFATTGLAVLRAHLGDDLGPIADQAEAALTEPLDEAWLAAEQITFLGRGWAYGLAQEAALKMREASLGWTEAYLAMEYRHGPISIAEPGRVVWHFGPGGADLRDEVTATGARFVDHPDDPQADLVRVQRLAVERGRRAGLDPDRPRHLSRSVVLG